jgi:predicted deacylase
VARSISRIPLSTRGSELTVITLAAGGERRKAPSRAPVATVTANIHGDECTGVGVVLRLAAMLDAMLVRGTVHLYPTLNPEGLERRTRKVPEDDQDLNRVFPGDPDGGPSERLANAAWNDLASRHPDVVVDLHADAPGSLPYALLDRCISLRGQTRQELEQAAERLAVATGLTVLNEYPDERYARYRLDRSLTGAVLNRLRIPAITIEAGPRLALDEDAVHASTAGVLGVLHALGMVADAPAPHPSLVTGGTWRRDSGPRAATSGILVMRARPGRLLARGEPVAEIRSLAGAVLEEPAAEAPGFVVSSAERAHVVAGVPVCTYAVAE